MGGNRIVLIAVLAFLVMFPTAYLGPRVVDTVRLIDHAGQGFDGGRLAERAAPTIRDIDLPPATRARLYTPGDACPRAAAVFVPGATPAGIDDPGAIGLAAALAKQHFAVLAVEPPGLRQLILEPAMIDTVRAGILWVSARSRPEEKVLVIAPSLGAVAAIRAALPPEMGARVRAVVAIGAIHDVEEALAARAGTAAARLRWRVVASHAGLLDDPGEAAAVATIAATKAHDPGADIADQVAELTPAGRSLIRLAENTDPGLSRVLVAALPAPLKDRIAALDLKDVDLSGFAPELVMLHGRDDPLASLEDAHALMARVPRASLAVVDALGHVDLADNNDLTDGWQLFRFGLHFFWLRDAIHLAAGGGCWGAD